MATSGVSWRLGVLAALLATGQSRGAEPETVWLAGSARVEITPDGPIWMSGYASRKTPSQGVEHPLQAKALALRDARGTALLWITADIIGFDREFTDRVAGRLQRQHGLPRAAIALFASHTHTGPTLKVSEESFRERAIDPASDAARNNLAFRRELEEKLVALAGRAMDGLAPATVSYGVGRADFAMNRRERTPKGYKIGVNPDGPTDRSVPVLRVVNARGEPLAIVFGYACHNTTLTDKTFALSGDYAGFAQTGIEARHPGAVALFITGCAGDANPEPRGTSELSRKHGAAMADAVESVLAEPLLPLSGPLRAAFADPVIHFSGPNDRASYERRLEEPGEGRRAHARRLIAALDAGGPIRTEHPYPMHAFALGDQLAVLALAGEVVADYAIRLKREAGGRLWVAAYSDDVFGYVGSARVVREGGYEGLDAYYSTDFATPLSEDAEETIVATARDLLTRVRGH